MDADAAKLFGDLSALSPESSYRDLLKAARKVRAARSQHPEQDVLPGMVATPVAIIGNSTLTFARDPLTAHLAARGIQASVMIGQYDGYMAEIMDPASEILSSKPSFLIIHLNHHAVSETPSLDSTAEECHEMAQRQVSFWRQLWHTAHQACGCNIIQTNIAIPIERANGVCESSQPFGAIHYLRSINQLLTESLPPYVTICDAEHLSGAIGKRHWFDLPHWYASRQPVHFDALAQLADSFSAIIAGKLGRSKKCLVLDLDNTLWGGVLGDVGQENLRVQRGDSVGEAHLDFQAYCRRLKQRGVLLAVCSKNEEALAKRVFESHPDMLLRLDDISAFVANWDDKATNLRKIASQLNIGLDSLVFVDDHPAERELVRQLLPMVMVPEVPSDPASYVRILDRHAYFETSELSSEDLLRAQQYNQQRDRQQAESSFTDLNDFLVSLQQSCVLSRVDEQSLPRVVQLLNKTNQFNLTTRRHTLGDLEDRLSDCNSVLVSVRHQDRFGDNGIIATLVARIEANELVIEDWVMSCRVFKRGIEDCLFGELVSLAGQLNLSSIRGIYRPSERNQIVAALYLRYGMTTVASLSGQLQEEQVWRLEPLSQAVLPSHTLRCDSQSMMTYARKLGSSRDPVTGENYHEPRVA